MASPTNMRGDVRPQFDYERAVDEARMWEGALAKAQARAKAEARDNHRFLVGAYMFAVLVPIVGMLTALYTAVAGRRAAVRRHAIAIGAVALLAAGGYIVAILAITSATQDRNIASDLRALMDSNGIRYEGVSGCVHQSGNQYVCTVKQSGRVITVQVTDDGKDVYEQGIAPVA
jgi:hypothetical protein